MLENRSFDHIFGAFPGVDGSTTGSNLTNPSDSPSPSNPILSQYAIDVNSQPIFNPDHAFGAMMVDIFGPNAHGYTSGKPMYTVAPAPKYPKMCGFVYQNSQRDRNGNAPVMSYFDYLQPGEDGRLNVLHTLAENFVVFDNWFAETPAMTCPNRHFAHLATNLGNNGNNPSAYVGPGVAESDEEGENVDSPPLFVAKTIYQLLDEMAPDSTPNWAMYGFPWDEYDSAMYKYTSPPIEPVPDPTSLPANLIAGNRNIMDFSVDVLTGKLPFYTFIMPSLLFGGNWTDGNSMHPSGDVRLGENLVASVYNVLRNSPIWEETLLIVTFDENGGIYDHVPPHATTPPDQWPYRDSNTELFDYSISGPRIPAIAISPWVQNKVCSDFLQNSSILKFTEELMASRRAVAPISLTGRDRNATSLANVDIWADAPNLDCPLTIPLYEGFPVWGATLTDPHGDSFAEKTDADGAPYYEGTGPFIQADAQTAPLKAQESGSGIEQSAPYGFAAEYCAYYPGHPDSGAPLTRRFGSLRELRDYMQERRLAARKYYAKHRPT